MTDPQQPDPTQQPPVGPDQQQPEPMPAPGEVRSQLLASVAKAREEPDMAGNVYASMGISMPVSLAGYQDSVARLKPGDLVGWHGGQQGDGQYVGQAAIYLGNRKIMERFYGTNRTRDLTPQDNVFGMPVIITGNAPETEEAQIPPAEANPGGI